MTRAVIFTSKRREIELDFIRGVAIVMVLDNHSIHPILSAPLLWLGFPRIGWVGVDLFFVLSGFLVGGLLVKEWKLDGRIDGKQFLIRRAFKIWPQYYLFLFVNLLAGHRSLHQLWGNLLNIQNYVGGIAHTWTLAVEEHAYLFLLVFLALAARLGIRMRYVYYGLLVIIVLVLIDRFTLTAISIDAFSRTDSRVDGILYGVILAILYHYAPDRFRRIQKQRWVWIAIIIVTLAFFRFIFIGSNKWSVAVSWWLADLSGIAALLLLYHRRGQKRSIAYRVVAWIGLYSYGIYLWHVSVGSWVVWLGNKLPLVIRTWFEAFADPIAGIALGALCTGFIEFPALRLRDRLFPRHIDSPVDLPAKIEAETGLRAG